MCEPSSSFTCGMATSHTNNLPSQVTWWDDGRRCEHVQRMEGILCSCQGRCTDMWRIGLDLGLIPSKSLCLGLLLGIFNHGKCNKAWSLENPFWCSVWVAAASLQDNMCNCAIESGIICRTWSLSHDALTSKMKRQCVWECVQSPWVRRGDQLVWARGACRVIDMVSSL